MSQTEKRNQPIGIFDSGVGGLTVAREIMRQMPDERLIYFGDTARVPYGGKSRETVLRYARQITRFLISRDVKAVVVACNTATAFALEDLQKEFDLPVIGVIHPGAEAAAAATKNGRVGVIGTQGTIGSGIYEAVLGQLNPAISVFGKACPLLCPLVEEGWLDDPITIEVIHRYLAELKKQDVDTLVLGCTHYPLLRHQMEREMGPEVALINPAYETAVTCKRVLMQHRLLCDTPAITGEDADRYCFTVSDDPQHLQRFAESVLRTEVGPAEKIDIEQY